MGFESFLRSIRKKSRKGPEHTKNGAVLDNEPKKGTKLDNLVQILDNIAKGFWSVLKIGGYILIIIYVGIIFHWASEKDNGIIVQSFEISNIGENISGTSIADLLSSELQDIAETNERMQRK